MIRCCPTALYLSRLCGLFGDDMNGIARLMPERTARAGFGGLPAVNAPVFWKRVLPAHREAFQL